MTKNARPFIQTSEVPVPPEIEIHGDRICWSIRNWKSIRLVRPSRAMLDQFLSLSNADVEQMRAFARKYGVLAICEHGKPTSHDLRCGSAPCPEIRGWSEPLDRWRYYAKQFQAVLRIADRLNRNQLGTREDWAVIDPQQDPSFPARTTKTMFARGMAGARNRLASIVNDFLDLGAVKPQLFPDGSNWRIYYHSVANDTVFGALAIQLLHAVASVDGFAICSACGDPYDPERTPRPDQNNYCSRKCQKKGWARASRKYRRGAPAVAPDLGARLDTASDAEMISHNEQAARIGIGRSTYFEVKAGRGGKKARRLAEKYLRSLRTTPKPD